MKIMFKRFIAMFLVVAMTISVVPSFGGFKIVEAAGASDGTLDGFTKHTKKLYDDFEKMSGYERPSTGRIISDYQNSPQYGKHPRLIITKSYVDSIKESKNVSGSTAAYLSNATITRANVYSEQLLGSNRDSYLFNYTKCYENRMPGSKSTTLASNEFLDKMLVLGMAYQISDDSNAKKNYANAAWEMLKRITDDKFYDINPWHDLDFGYFCQGYAIAYDWMYDAWSDSQKQTIQNAIKRQCFRPANDSFTNNKISRSQTSGNGVCRGVWLDNNHNGFVNSGIAMVSLALMDEYPDITSSLCRDSIICLEKYLNTFAPDGLSPESVEYFLHTLDNLSMIFSSLESSIGSLYGLDKCEGLTGGKIMTAVHGMESDVGAFSFGDTYDSFIENAGELYFDKHYNLTGYRNEIFERLKTKGDSTCRVKMLCWYEPDKNGAAKNINRDMIIGEGEDYTGITSFATFRNNFNSGQTFVGIKAGRTARKHFIHLDQGSFVFHSQGVKWATDMGKDNYDLTGYMKPDESEVNNRWKIFRLRPDAHNTLLIDPNPDDYGYEFDKLAILSTDTSESQAKAVVDMTNLVSKKANSAKRGFLFTDNRNSLVIRDEVELKQASDLYWVMYTEQKVEINGKCVILSSGDKKLKIDFVSSSDGSLDIQSAARWKFAPTIDTSNGDNNKNDKYHRIVYKISGASGFVTITAKLTPQIEATKDSSDVSTYGDISLWNLKTDGTGTDNGSKEDDALNKDSENNSEDNNSKNENIQNGNTQFTNTQDGTSKQDGTYEPSEKINKNNLQKNKLVADKKSGGKFKITKIIKKKGRIVGGTATYMAPYNRNCTKASVSNNVKLGGVKFKVTAINMNAFKNCKKLKFVCIGTNVTKIGTNAFRGCSKLKSVTIRSKKIVKIGAKAFYGINKKVKFKVPKVKFKKLVKLINKAGAPKSAKITK